MCQYTPPPPTLPYHRLKCVLEVALSYDLKMAPGGEREESLNFPPVSWQSMPTKTVVDRLSGKYLKE